MRLGTAWVLVPDRQGGRHEAYVEGAAVIKIVNSFVWYLAALLPALAALWQAEHNTDFQTALETAAV